MIPEEHSAKLKTWLKSKEVKRVVEEEMITHARRGIEALVGVTAAGFSTTVRLACTADNDLLVVTGRLLRKAECHAVCMARLWACHSSCTQTQLRPAAWQPRYAFNC